MKTAVLTALLVSLSSSLNAHGHAFHFTRNSRRSTISTYPEDLNGTLRTIGLYNATDRRNYQEKPLILLLLGEVPQASLLPVVSQSQQTILWPSLKQVTTARL